MAIIKWTEMSPQNIFGNNQFYQWLATIFAEKSHTHTKSDITNFSHTHTKSDVTDFSHTHTKSDITNFSHTHTKSDITNFSHTHTKSEISDFPSTMPPSSHSHTKSEITDFPSTMPPSSHNHTISDITDGGLTTYTVSASDYDSTNLTTCAITFNKQGSIVTCIYHLVTVSFNNKTDHTVLASGKIPSEYRPSDTFYQNVCTYNGDKLDGLLTVNTNGSMYIRMGTANTSMNIYGSLTYIV